MIQRNHLSEHDVFEVTDSLIDCYYNIYRELYPPCKPKKTPKASDIRLSRRIAGLNLMALNEQRFSTEIVVIEKASKLRQKCGFVYLISNPAFPDKFKVGMTANMQNRLSAYQTYDPYRLFKVENYKFVTDKRQTEKNILEHFSVDIVNGEWIENDKAQKIFLSLEV